MALDATKGLPSFSEMYTAFKNRGNLGDAITGGIGAYQAARSQAGKERMDTTDIALKEAQTKEHLSKANQDPYKDYQDISTLAPTLSKEQFEVLKLSATPVNGKLMLPKSQITSMIPLVKEQGAERRAELARLEERRKMEEMLAAQAARQGESERAADERLSSTQEMGALQATARLPEPKMSLASELASKIPESIPLVGSLAAPAREKAAQRETIRSAQGELSRRALKSNLNPPNAVDKATGIMPTPQFATEAELDAAIQAGIVKVGDKVIVAGTTGTAR